MKKPTQFALLLYVVLTILINGCVPTSTPNPPASTPIPPTFTSKPTAIPFVMPKGDFEMSWDIYSSEYFSTHCVLTIRRLGSKYSEKLVCPDGSSGIFDLTVISEGNEINLTGHLGITSSLYGDYMVINSRGWLVFNDSQGYIYSVPPGNWCVSRIMCWGVTLPKTKMTLKIHMLKGVQ